MKLLKKISIGSINGARGGLRDITGRVMVGVIAGITSSYKEKTSETMGVSYGFIGEFRAINRDGEECAAPVCYLPEPTQSLLKAQIDDLQKSGAQNVEFAFRFYAVEDDTAVKGYVFEAETLQTAAPSSAVAELAHRVGIALPSASSAPALEHKPEDESEGVHAASAPHGKVKGKAK